MANTREFWNMLSSCFVLLTSNYFVPSSHRKTCGIYRIMGRPSVFPVDISAGSARVMGAPGMFVIWRPLQPISFELFRPRTGLANLPHGACSKDNFHRNPFVSESQSLVAPYFWLFQGRLSAPYSSVLQAVVRLAFPLFRPWSCVISHCVTTVSSTTAYVNCSCKCFVSTLITWYNHSQCRSFSDEIERHGNSFSDCRLTRIATYITHIHGTVYALRIHAANLRWQLDPEDESTKGRSNINRPLSVATSEWARLGNDLVRRCGGEWGISSSRRHILPPSQLV
jgi:hypothetical protein